jgi:hypothetical protein
MPLTQEKLINLNVPFGWMSTVNNSNMKPVPLNHSSAKWKNWLKKNSLTKTVKENLQAALTYYFKNHRHMMAYAEHIESNLPIGSGIIEAACKTLVKQRLCGSGMRWKDKGAKVILSLRALVQTQGRWQQFWNKIDQFGSQVYA